MIKVALCLIAVGMLVSHPSPAAELTRSTGTHSGSWEGRTAGEQITSDAGSKTVDVTSLERVATIGLELLPSPPPPDGTTIVIRQE